MKAASLSQLKKELELMPNQRLIDLCIRISKYKKENKELLHYLLFESHDEAQYIRGVKDDIEDAFEDISRHNMHHAGKSLRKILKMTNKFIKYSGSKRTEAELLIFYCQKMKESGIRYYRYAAMQNLYDRQILKIEKAIATLHEDLQYDMKKELEGLGS